MAEYAGLGLYLALGAGLVAIFLFLATVIGPRPRLPAKDEPFECGERQIVSPYQRFSVKYYMVAVSFIIFDVGVVYLFPWAVVWGDLGWFGYLSMLLFLFVISVGLAYEWLKGGLDWS